MFDIAIPFFKMLFKSLLGFVAVAAASPISTEDYTKALETRGLCILPALDDIRVFY